MDDVWWLRVLIEVLFFFAVPVFFMLSGATLMNYREKYSTKVFIRKRFLRAFVPYLIWGVIFTVLFLTKETAKGEEPVTWREVISYFTTGKIPLTNYWFFIPLFLIYAFLPFLSIMVKGMTKSQIAALCGLMIALQFVLPTIYAIMGVEFEMTLPIGGFFVYALLGFYLSISDFEKNGKLVLLVVLMALISLVARYILVLPSEDESPALWTYYGLYALLPAASLFLLAKRMAPPTVKPNRISRLSGVFSFMAKRSYGIFLIHTFLLKLLAKVIDIELWYFIPIGILFGYFGSLLIVWLCQKSRMLKWLLP